MTEAEIERIAERAAEKAISEFAMLLGVDTSNKAAIIEARTDLDFVRSLRRSAEMAKGTVIKTGVGVLITGLLGLIWWAIQHGGR